MLLVYYEKQKQKQLTGKYGLKASNRARKRLRNTCNFDIEQALVMTCSFWTLFVSLKYRITV